MQKNVKYYIGQPFDKKHEKEAQAEFKKVLDALFAEIGINAHVVFSFWVGGNDFDCVIFCESFVMVIDFKRFRYKKLAGAENGNWAVISPEGHRKSIFRANNPYRQVKICRSKLARLMVDKNMATTYSSVRGRWEKQMAISNIIGAGIIADCCSELQIDRGIRDLISRNKWFFVETIETAKDLIRKMHRENARKAWNDREIEKFILTTLACQRIKPEKKQIKNSKELQALVEFDKDRDLAVESTAGAGKTRFIVDRARYLIARKVPSNKIAIITYTNQASSEIIGRLVDNGGVEGRSDLYACGTIHNFCNKIIHQHFNALGYSEKPGVIDEGFARTIFRNHVIPKLELNIDGFTLHKIFGMITNLEIQKDKDIEYYLEDRWPDEIDKVSFKKACEEYLSYLISKNWICFESILIFCKRLLGTDSIFSDLKKDISCLLIDEFQDITKIEFEVFRMLNNGGIRLNFAGDPLQAIYAFRGALPNSFDLAEDTIRPQIRQMKVNYRSGGKIVKFANEYIKANYEGYKDFPVSADGKKNEGAVYFKTFPNQRKEAEFIVSEIERLRDEGVPLSQISILYRSSKPVDVVKHVVAEMDKRNLPYYNSKEPGFKDQRHVKQVVCFLDAVYSDEISEERFYEFCRLNVQGVRKKVLWYWMQYCVSNDMDEFLAKLRGAPAEYRDELLVRMFEEVKRLKGQEMSKTVESFYENFHAELPPLIKGNRDAVSNDFDRLCALGEDVYNINDFMDKINMEYIAGSRNGVNILTMHSSKGRQFHSVFVVGLNDGILPHANYIKGMNEEEKNLLYVAMTRPMVNLYLNYSRKIKFKEMPLCPYLNFAERLFEA